MPTVPFDTVYDPFNTRVQGKDQSRLPSGRPTIPDPTYLLMAAAIMKENVDKAKPWVNRTEAEDAQIEAQTAREKAAKTTGRGILKTMNALLKPMDKAK